ncbi:MAG: hypothetical protein JKY23_00400 [Nitrospinaceae bacterium]|nr:hypothetical protein [Nitrospinaceae bacterium]
MDAEDELVFPFPTGTYQAAQMAQGPPLFVREFTSFARLVAAQSNHTVEQFQRVPDPDAATRADTFKRTADGGAARDHMISIDRLTPYFEDSILGAMTNALLFVRTQTSRESGELLFVELITRPNVRENLAMWVGAQLMFIAQTAGTVWARDTSLDVLNRSMAIAKSFFMHYHGK